MFVDNIHGRIRFIFVVVLIMFVLIVIRVFIIHVIDYNKLNDLADNLWSRNLPITSDRGLITDRNGKVLADNITTVSLVLIPNQIKNKKQVSIELAKILGVKYEDMYKHVSKKTSIERVHPEGRQLSYQVADEISKLNYDGVYLVKESKRYYPYKTLLSHVLGYVGIDNQGLSGIELEYDSYLTGKNGAIKYYSDGKGKRLDKSEVYVEPQNGINLSLTIDLDIQLTVERELDNVVTKYNPEQALMIVADPNTGEILAMSSRPNFDSNNYKNYDINTINRNLPIWATYEPGSTFKIITLAASLEEKTINIFDDHFHDSGSIHVENARIKCWKKGGHGDQTFLQVVENSCNPGFVVMGQKLGTERLYNYITNFGFGKKTGIDLNGESSGILFKYDNIGPVEQATMSFGQGISVTPIQQVVGVSAAINGGYLNTPYIVKYLSEPETNNIILENKKSTKRQVVSEETSKLVRHTLESVVANGTGKNAYIENYRVGGKTGTAQKVNNGIYMVGNYILSFIGFLPADKPEYIVYVAIDNPKGVTQYGGTVSAPIAKNVMKSIIDIKNIKQDNSGMIRNEYTWLDTKYVMMPDVVGMSLKDAQKTLEGFKIEYAGTGETVIEQEPASGQYIKETNTIKLMLN